MGTRVVLGAIRDVLRPPSKDDGPSDFDLRYNVDTSGTLSLSALEVDADASLHGNQYQAIYLDSFDELLAKYIQELRAYVFVDLGSGKGRAVLLATMLPFQRVTGVEFSEELNQAARKNLTTFTGDVQCEDTEILTLDAGQFAFDQAKPLVLYIYNSFDAVIMQRVIDNLIASFEQAPRDILVLYFNPMEIALWRAVDCLVELETTEDYAVFRTSL